MTNGTLLVNNSNGLANDIWQYNGEFEKEDWEKSLVTFRNAVADAKLYIEELEDGEFGDDRLYILGDIINLFDSINVEMKKDCK